MPCSPTSPIRRTSPISPSIRKIARAFYVTRDCKQTVVEPKVQRACASDDEVFDKILKLRLKAVNFIYVEPQADGTYISSLAPSLVAKGWKVIAPDGKVVKK